MCRRLKPRNRSEADALPADRQQLRVLARARSSRRVCVRARRTLALKAPAKPRSPVMTSRVVRAFLACACSRGSRVRPDVA